MSENDSLDSKVSSTNKSPWSKNNAPPHLNPNNLNNIGTLREWGLPEGQNADCMLVGENKCGKKVFITNTTEHLSGLEAEYKSKTLNAEKSSIFLSELGFSVPEHYYCNQFLAVEECEGQLLETSDTDSISRDKFLKFASGQILIGNEDARPCNVFIKNGELVPIDLDMSARSMSSLSIKRCTLDSLFESSLSAGVYNRVEKNNFISDLREELRQTVKKQPVEQAIDKIECRVSKVFAGNIQRVRNEELISKNKENIWT